MGTFFIPNKLDMPARFSWESLPGSGLGRLAALIDDINGVEAEEDEE